MRVLFYFSKMKTGVRRYIFNGFSAIQLIVLFYALLTFVSLALFYLPIFRVPNVHVRFLDMLFMAISTTSVTGLSTFDISTVFNEKGIVLLEILFQIGGLGIMMISTLIFLFSRKKISLKQRQLIMIDMNQPKLSGVVRLIRITLIVLIAIQVVFGIVFGIHFFRSGRFHTIPESFFWGIYESISSVTNSGFDVTGYSLIPYAKDYSFLFTVMFLIFIGGIGFPVLLDFIDWTRSKFALQTRFRYRFSLFSKLAVTTWIGLFIVGSLLIFVFEKDHLWKSVSLVEGVVHSMFYSISTRNAGLQINHLIYFQPNTLLVFSFLMFIGCSPSSVGGGVRTTTLVIVVLYMISFLKGKENVSIFGRQISPDDIKKSVVVLNLSLLFCFLACLILMATEKQQMIAIVVEVASAFGTTGLSLGITPDLTDIGKITIAALMFIGRVGTLYMLMLFVPKQKQDSGYLYPTEKIIIG